MIHSMDAQRFMDRIGLDKLDMLEDYLVNAPKVEVDGPWLAGGALRRILTGDSLDDGDFDYFFKNSGQQQLFHEQLIRKGAKVLRNEDHVTEYEVRMLDAKTMKVQAIKMKYFPTVREMLQDFDYTCCMIAYDGLDIHYGEWTLWDNARKRLVVNKIQYPVASLRRLVKYTSQGYYACQGTMMDIATTIHTMDPIDFKNSEIKYVD
jgi:hypothetical protein